MLCTYVYCISDLVIVTIDVYCFHSSISENPEGPILTTCDNVTTMLLNFPSQHHLVAPPLLPEKMCLVQTLMAELMN